MRTLLNILTEDVLGHSEPIPLSQIKSKNATMAAGSGTKDGDMSDDATDADLKARVTVGSLKPMQKEVIPDKALSFALGFLRDGTPDLDDMEAIVSNDNYIMDGHHRWAARTLIDPNAKVTVAAIDLPAADLVSALNIYTAARGVKGNVGTGDVTQFASSIPKLLSQLRTNGNANFDPKGSWPKIDASEVDELLGKVPGANGDADKGMRLMISNAKKLPTNKHPEAPDRIDMPVIDAAKGDLKKVVAKIKAGELDIHTPYSRSTKTAFGIDDHKINKGSKLNESIDKQRWQHIANIKKKY